VPEKTPLPNYVLAIDPGKRTGYSLFDTQTNKPPWVGEFEFEAGCAWLETWLTGAGPRTAVAVERFIIDQRTVRNSQAPWSLEMIGVVRYLAHKYSAADLKLQDVPTAKRFSSDARLKTLGWWRPGLGHGNDASRHTLLYLVSHGWWTPVLDPDRVAATEVTV
jgi:hypothetical protein